MVVAWWQAAPDLAQLDAPARAAALGELAAAADEGGLLDLRDAVAFAAGHAAGLGRIAALREGIQL